MEGFFNNLNELELLVTQRASNSLQEFEERVVKKAKEDVSLTENEANELNILIRELRLTLEAELRGRNAYVTQPKMHDLQKLIHEISGLFHPNTFDKLDEIARYDFQEAGKCIAFERSTAGAFHILRGTESVLRSFYMVLVKQKRIKKPFMWGPMTDHLRTKSSAKSYMVLLNHLDHIRLSFRNPTQHPEKIYDIYEVQELFNLCIDSINRMSKAL